MSVSSVVKEYGSGCVAAIGNFDGVHVGHRALLADAEELAKEYRAPLAVLTFSPHPKLFFQPDAPPFALTSPEDRRELLRRAGAHDIIELPFDAELAAMSAEAFIEEILVKRLAAKHVVVGEDFAFGHRRGGSVETLRADGRFGVTAVYPAAARDGTVYASSTARARLAAGDFAGALEMLGQPWTRRGKVIHGDKRGRTLGFPTANQAAGDYVRMPYGVYAVRAQIEGESAWRGGVANFGVRPMFEIAQPLLETHLFDFGGDIYGKDLRVEPLRHLRGEMKLPSLEALSAQIKEDCRAAQAVLESQA